MHQLSHRSSLALALALALSSSLVTVFAFGTLGGCAAPTPGTTDTTTTESALVGTVDATSATECATAYVTSARAGKAKCLDDAKTCIAAATTTTTTTTTDAGSTSDAGVSETPVGKSKGGMCSKDGTIDESGIQACLGALESCAASTTPAATCVADAVTCVTATSDTTDTDAASSAPE